MGGWVGGCVLLDLFGTFHQHVRMLLLKVVFLGRFLKNVLSCKLCFIFSHCFGWYFLL